MHKLLKTPNIKEISAIEKVMASIEKALPIPAKHRQGLAYDIKDLSEILTEERGSLSRPYWAKPALSSAYTHYFLPWNLFRMVWLLPNLNLSLASGAKILDLGSGPLTLPLALWCARPELRVEKLHFICTDISSQPLEMGKKIFEKLAPESQWTFDLVRSPIESALSKAPHEIDLILSGNVLNELKPAKGRTLFQRIDELVLRAAQKLKTDGNFLLVEPGTRLGGKVISLARESALAAFFDILAPCTHSEACPALESIEQRQDRKTNFNSWCHFSCPSKTAPYKLIKLTREAGFERESLALSFLYLKKSDKASLEESNKLLHLSQNPDLNELEAIYAEVMAEETDYEPEHIGSLESVSSRIPKRERLEKLTSPCKARIISGPIRIPGQIKASRYACSENGLLLLADSEHLDYGDCVKATVKSFRDRDRKSGALLASLTEKTKVLDEEKVRTKVPEHNQKSYPLRTESKNIKDKNSSREERSYRPEKKHPHTDKALKFPTKGQGKKKSSGRIKR